MNKKRKIVHGIILTALLLFTAFLVLPILADPLGEHDVILPLAVTAGFIILNADKRKSRGISSYGNNNRTCL